MDPKPDKGMLARLARRRLPLGDQRGASLIEIIIATLILGLVSIGMVEFFARGGLGFDREERKRVAVLLAQEALERTLARPYPAIATWNENRTVGGVDYAITVTSTEDVPEDDIKMLEATVVWNVTATATRDARLTTFVYDSN